MKRQTLYAPIRLGRGQNNRSRNYLAAHHRMKREKQDIGYFLSLHQGAYGLPSIPCSVLLTRIAPGNGLDDDNLVGAFKSVRDAIADWLGVDDKHTEKVRYLYAQRRGREWGVEIEFKEQNTEDNTA